MMDLTSFAMIFVGAVPLFLKLHSVEILRADQEQFVREQSGSLHQEQKKFDFIVVGAGTAGCVIASRLSEKFSVLLLEAGGPPPSGVEVPALFALVAEAPELNYAYTSVPQKRAKNRKITRTVGKMMGGTYSHNGLLYNRGNSLDYDNWATLTRDDSWKYENVLPLFKNVENYMGKFPSDQHGTGGPLTIETDYRPILATWFRAAKELKYKVGDPNGPQTEGFMPNEVTRRLGRRETTFTAYIQPIIESQNRLKIIKFSHVSRILFSRIKKNKAIGVSYTRHGVQFSAFARKEIIVSAGVFGSPLLMFKSGIGPFKMLKEAGISPLVSDLPVGKSLRDHHGVRLGPVSINDPTKLSNIYNNLTESRFNEYNQLKEEGVLSSPAIGPQGFFVEGETENTRLALVDYNFLPSPDDRETLLYEIHLALKIFDTEAFRVIDTKLIPDEKCAQHHTFNTSSYWDCFIRNFGRTDYHTVGTCPMGFGTGDPKAVTDSKFRVLGVKRLSIADASIMPQITNGNSNAPTVLIGEKAATEILARHGYGR